MKKTSVIATLALAIVGNASAGDLVTGGTLAKVTNTASNGLNFSVFVTGGTNNLCTGGWITFPLSAAPDVQAHQRAYAAALLAMSTGAPVRIHNYQGNSCVGASYIEIG